MRGGTAVLFNGYPVTRFRCRRAHGIQHDVGLVTFDSRTSPKLVIPSHGDLFEDVNAQISVGTVADLAESGPAVEGPPVLDELGANAPLAFAEHNGLNLEGPVSFRVVVLDVTKTDTEEHVVSFADRRFFWTRGFMDLYRFNVPGDPDTLEVRGSGPDNSFPDRAWTYEAFARKVMSRVGGSPTVHRVPLAWGKLPLPEKRFPVAGRAVDALRWLLELTRARVVLNLDDSVSFWEEGEGVVGWAADGRDNSNPLPIDGVLEIDSGQGHKFPPNYVVVQGGARIASVGIDLLEPVVQIDGDYYALENAVAEIFDPEGAFVLKDALADEEDEDKRKQLEFQIKLKLDIMKDPAFAASDLQMWQVRGFVLRPEQTQLPRGISQTGLDILSRDAFKLWRLPESWKHLLPILRRAETAPDGTTRLPPFLQSYVFRRAQKTRVGDEAEVKLSAIQGERVALGQYLALVVRDYVFNNKVFTAAFGDEISTRLNAAASLRAVAFSFPIPDSFRPELASEVAPAGTEDQPDVWQGVWNKTSRVDKQLRVLLRNIREDPNNTSVTGILSRLDPRRSVYRIAKRAALNGLHLHRPMLMLEGTRFGPLIKVQFGTEDLLARYKQALAAELEAGPKLSKDFYALDLDYKFMEALLAGADKMRAARDDVSAATVEIAQALEILKQRLEREVQRSDLISAGEKASTSDREGLNSAVFNYFVNSDKRVDVSAKVEDKDLGVFRSDKILGHLDLATVPGSRATTDTLAGMHLRRMPVRAIFGTRIIPRPRDFQVPTRGFLRGQVGTHQLTSDQYRSEDVFPPQMEGGSDDFDLTEDLTLIFSRADRGSKVLLPHQVPRGFGVVVNELRRELEERILLDGSTNRQALVDKAREVAIQRFNVPSTVETSTAVFVGPWAVVPNGKVSGVEWNLAGDQAGFATTVIVGHKELPFANRSKAVTRDEFEKFNVSTRVGDPNE